MQSSIRQLVMKTVFRFVPVSCYWCIDKDEMKYVYQQGSQISDYLKIHPRIIYYLLKLKDDMASLRRRLLAALVDYVAFL